MLPRPAQPEDNIAVANIIRSALIEFGANHGGTAWQDPEIDTISQTYSPAGSCYLIIELDGNIVGGAGIARLSGGHETECELQKMYLESSVRGKGFGKLLLSALLTRAKEYGYDFCYLETLPNMKQAMDLYESMGFKRLDQAKGNTGHHQCDVYYGKNLTH